ncbi:MAG: ATP-binding cassette domain-containing protein, partial [Eubacteriales bacterium]|nr:ATP-binding cassette domain-containing protein [Eubacteriales bacterium]
MSLLSLNNISKTYARVKVLDAVALDIMPGDRIALIGDNGAGKTTLLRLIAGSETADPESGHIQLARGTVLGYLEQQLEH